MKIALLIVAIAMMAGCKDATVAQWNSLGKPHTITVYSGGVAVKVFHSTGNVSNEPNSDGWYFEDRDTHKLVEVAGSLVIEQD